MIHRRNQQILQPLPVQRWPQELQLPTREIGPREEPEVFPTMFLLNDGRWTAEEHDALLRKAAQAFNNRDMERERRDAEQREREAHERSIREWQAQVELQQLAHPSLPCGPPPKGDFLYARPSQCS